MPLRPVLTHNAAPMPAQAPAFVVWRLSRRATLAELAVDKNTAGEAPHPYARVAVFRLLDLKKVWEGFADAQGRWQADGLQPGREYVALGIDQQRVYKATAAGPVTATTDGGANG